MPLTDEGLEALRTADYLDIVRDSLDAELASRGFTGSIDYDRDIFLGGITAVMASLLGDAGQMGLAVYNARDPNNATGIQLSSLSLAVGITRNPATPSAVVLTCAGTPGTVIPSGKAVRGGGEDGQALWVSRTTATIGGGGSVDVDFEAEEPGATQAPAGTSWEIVTAVFGWQTATNAADATVGDARETDDQLRLRRQESLQIAGSAATKAIRARVLEVDGVSAAVVLENVSDIALTIEGLALEPHSVGVVVEPSTLSTEQKTDLVRVIYNNTATGIETSGSESATVIGLDLAEKVIRWSWATLVGVEALIEIEPEPPSATDPDPPTYAELEPQVQAVADAYGLALGLGEDVRKLPILGDIDAIYGVRSVVVTLTCPTDPSKVQATGDVLILATELASFTATVQQL